MCIPVENRGQPWVLFLRNHLPCVLRQVCHWPPGTRGLGEAGWAVCPSDLPTHPSSSVVISTCPYAWLFCGFWGVNSGPHALVAHYSLSHPSSP